MVRVGHHSRLLIGTPEAERDEEHMQQSGVIRILDVLLHQLPVARNPLPRIAENRQLAGRVVRRKDAIEIGEHIGAEIVFERRNRRIERRKHNAIPGRYLKLVESMIFELEVGRHPALATNAAPIRHTDQVALQVVIPLVIRATKVRVVAEVLLAELHPAVRAAILDDVDSTLAISVDIANHDDLPLADERPLEVARIRNLREQPDVAPVRPVKDPLELALIQLLIGVSAERNFGQRLARPRNDRGADRIGDRIHVRRPPFHPTSSARAA